MTQVDDYEDEFQRRARMQQEYYAKCQPDKPAPLPFNSFEPGKYGMRRRLRVAETADTDAEKLFDFMESNMSMFR